MSQVQRDTANEISVAPSITGTLLNNATKNGSSVDLSGFRSATVVVTVGTRVDGTHLFSLQESDTGAFGGEQNTVAAADLNGSFPADVTSNVPIKVGYLGSKRFVRVVATVTPGATGASYGAVVIKSRPFSKPTATP